MLYQILAITIASCIAVIEASEGVSLYSKVGQLVTSSTLKWQPYAGDGNLEFGVTAAKYVSEDDSYDIKVCRVNKQGLYNLGHTKQRDQKTLCVVPSDEGAMTHHVFEYLLNRGKGGKLTWKTWSKFNPSIPIGAVGSTEHVSLLFSIFYRYF